MLNLVAIFKMATTIPHKFNIVRFQRPELIPDIEKILPVSMSCNHPPVNCVNAIYQCYLNQTRYDYNLTIMKSPKPATDNRNNSTNINKINNHLSPKESLNSDGQLFHQYQQIQQSPLT
jgi:hypothetical protein